MSPTPVPAALLLLSLVPRQDDQQEEPALPVAPAEQFREEIRARLESEILGAWQLDVYLEDGIPAPPGEIEGEIVFADGYMSIVIHAIGFDEENQEEIPLAQAGIFRYQVDGFSALLTANVIGHATGLDDLEFEPSGVLREYALQVEGDLMRLRHRSGTTFSLSRVLEDDEIGAEAMLDAARAFGRDPRAAEKPEPADESADEEPADDEPLTPLMQAKKEERERVETDIVGGWRLVDYLQDGLPAPSTDIYGAATFADGHMSLVIHAVGYDEENDEELRIGQAGIFVYEIDTFGRLATSTVIGHANPYDEVEYEEAGDLREYGVRIDSIEGEPDVLTLDHETGTSLVFARMPPAALTEEELDRMSRERGFLDFVDATVAEESEQR
jgi:hypothetical protein